jgi:hypothetical protein
MNHNYSIDVLNGKKKELEIELENINEQFKRYDTEECIRMISQCPRSGVALSVKSLDMRKEAIESKLESINNIISNLEKKEIEMNKEIVNAKITGTKLGMNDYGHLTFGIYCEFSGNSCGFGGCSFGRYDDYTGEYTNFEFTSEIILRLLNTIG